MQKLKKVFLVAGIFVTFLLVSNIVKITTTEWTFIEIGMDNSIAMGSVEGYDPAGALFDYFKYGFPTSYWLLNPYYGVQRMNSEALDNLKESWSYQVALFSVVDVVLFLGYGEINRFMNNPDHKRLKFQIPIKLK